jgi:farnesyl diphosphate synthase
MVDLTQRLAASAARVEAQLAARLDDTVRPGETARPARLMAAMRHAVMGGGKRLRAHLVVECARAAGHEGEGIWSVAASLECLHAYSLVHDDLPSMDNDDLRRGKPTVHKAYDEATAILAGDALQTLAFELLAEPATHPDPLVRARLVQGLAIASGLGGMVGGQILDLGAEGRFDGGVPLKIDEAGIRALQAMKTGALLRFSCEAGAIHAGADATTLARFSRYGDLIGLAFQLADDLLDVEGSAEAVGKAVGKDAALGKATIVGLKGVAWARAALADLVDEALTLFPATTPQTAPLAAAARFVAERTH